MTRLASELEGERAGLIRRFQDEAKQECEREAQEVMITAMERYAGDCAYERTTSTIPLPTDEMKGRIIGREGRNIRALEALKRPAAIQVHTDSQYVQKGISEWIHNWKRNGWRTADKKPVKNADLWQQLDSLAHQHEIKWLWVKGHAGHPGNERADRLANRGIDELLAASR